MTGAHFLTKNEPECRFLTKNFPRRDGATPLAPSPSKPMHCNPQYFRGSAATANVVNRMRQIVLRWRYQFATVHQHH